MIELEMIPLELVRINGGTQSRVELNAATIADYTEAVRAAVDLPPVIAFLDGGVFWLADGFHRFHAHRAAGATEINADVRIGTQRDAILYSVGANASHGLRRTNEDKRRAVMTLLTDPEWSTWSNEAVARACNVSPHTVASAKVSISANTEISNVRTVERNGTTYQQDTANIGKVAPKPDVRPVASAPAASSKQPAQPAQADDDAPDMAQLAAELQRENEAYQRQMASLEADDPKAELVRLNQHLDQLNGRLQGEITTRNEATTMVKGYASLLEKIRKALNVESNRDILSALGAR